MLYTLLFVILVVVDQAVKFWVRANIPLGESIPFLPHIMDLTYTQNTGAAFSILREHTWLLTLLSAVLVVIVALLVAKRFIAGRLGLVAATLVLAGGIGNLIDRVALGYVTDMFQTTFMDFAIFNVADSCLTIGVVLLVVYVLFFYDKLHKKEAPKDHDHPAEFPSDRP